MRVVIITRSLNGLFGVAVHSKTLSKYLQKNGHEVIVFAVDVENIKSEKFSSQWIRPFQESQPFFNPYRSCIPAISLFIKLFKLHCSKRIDILHVHDSSAFYYVKIFSKIFRMPAIYTSHSLYVFNNRFNPYSEKTTKIYQRSAKYIAKHANCIIAVSNDVKNQLKTLNRGRDNVVVVPNFISIDCSIDTSSHKRKELRKRLLFVGSLTAIKGVSVLLKSMRVVLKQDSDITLSIVGDGPQQLALEQEAKDLEIISFVQFLGAKKQEELCEIYKNSDVLIVPSLDEAQGIVVLEAFAAGIPVIGSNVGGIPDMIEDGKNGLLFPPGNHDALANCILKFINNNNSYQKFSEEALNTAKEFSWDKGIARIIDVYHKAISEKS